MIEALNKNKKARFLRRLENRMVDDILEPIIYRIKARMVKLRTGREYWKNSRSVWTGENKNADSKRTYWKNMVDSWQKEDR